MSPDPVHAARRWIHRAPRVSVLALFSWVAWACDTSHPPPFGDPGEPLPDLTADQLARFEAGRSLFDSDISPELGLGPTFNQQRCSSCHDVPTLGGSGVERVLRITRWEDGRCDPLTEVGGDNVQPRVTDIYRELGGAGEAIPAAATHTVDMVAPSLYGIGLIEEIPAAAILSREDPNDTDGNGVSGRAGRTASGELARFGQKGSDATVRDFVQGALLQEMGITTAAHPRDLSVNGEPLPPDADPAPDPEFGAEQVDLLVDYLRLLAPPRPLAADSVGPDVGEGRRTFQEIGCENCHTARFVTAADAPAPLAGQLLPLYSDLLLHDMGPQAAGICSPSASPTEVRTAPLMGLRHRPILTHDGRASTLLDVIEGHGGEAQGSADAFATLSDQRRTALLRFLSTL